MARYTIHRRYEDKAAERDRLKKSLASRLKLYMVLVILKGGVE